MNPTRWHLLPGAYILYALYHSEWDCGIPAMIPLIVFFQVRIWSQPDKKDQTIHALTFAGHAYDFFADYFNTPEIVPKAGM